MVLDPAEGFLYPLEELSPRLGIDSPTIMGFVEEGVLKRQEREGRWYVSQESLREFYSGAGRTFCRRKSERHVLP